MPINDDEIPVFIINGFLEAGKTKFLKYTLDQDYFQQDGRTLLILCEEGDEEYPRDLLERTHTDMVTVSDISELTEEKLKAMEIAYGPERVIIEWNGIWMIDQFRLPDGWFLNQQVTVIDTSTFDVYLKNMKPLLGQMLRFSELVLCNRADEIPEEKLGSYYLQLKAMAQTAEIVFEGKDGEIRGDFNIELPYDINADFIEVKPEDFGIFYVDIMDRPQRYDGKKVRYTGRLLMPPELGPEAFVPGCMVMTCCATDMKFLGLICKYKGASAFKNGDWIKLTGSVHAEENREYGGIGPVIYCEEVVRTSPIEEVAGF
ncbi:MAG: GTP-binding protein [Lachnospiraceae bacterium]|nr:GTP-binding protein [Lachnospiraceae bacterium]